MVDLDETVTQTRWVASREIELAYLTINPPRVCSREVCLLLCNQAAISLAGVMLAKSLRPLQRRWQGLRLQVQRNISQREGLVRFPVLQFEHSALRALDNARFSKDGIRKKNTSRNETTILVSPHIIDLNSYLDCVSGIWLVSPEVFPQTVWEIHVGHGLGGFGDATDRNRSRRITGTPNNTSIANVKLGSVARRPPVNVGMATQVIIDVETRWIALKDPSSPRSNRRLWFNLKTILLEDTETLRFLASFEIFRTKCQSRQDFGC